MAVVREKMRWRGIPFGVTSAWGTTDLLLGEFGRGERGALITAGIHGDEGPWGGWAINKLLQSIDESDVDGLIRVVPLSNPLAMQADKRNAPVDQLDLNRVFPGDPTGSYTERVAHILATAALENIDYVVDLHGAAVGASTRLSLRWTADVICHCVFPRHSSSMRRPVMPV